MSRPQIDLNKPVENPELLLAIAEFTRVRNAQTEHELNRRLRSAIFLVPIKADEMHTTPSTKPGRVTIQPGSLIKLLSWVDDAGARYLPLFTDWPAIRAWTSREVSTIVMPAHDAWSFALSQAHYAGAVVNPGQGALPLSRSLIEYLKDEPKPA